MCAPSKTARFLPPKILFNTVPKIVRHIADLQRLLPSAGQIVLTPTMGALHEGHLSLARLGRTLADIQIVSIYVNPLQFGADEDFADYPRQLEADCEKLSGLADIIFAPDDQEMYPQKQTVGISLPPLAGELCGHSRPGFFEGVAAAVCKLFNCTRPQTAIFGKKDLQQLHLIRLMTAQLNYPIGIIAAPIIRDRDGLALSSRNAYLSPDERRRAVLLPQTLKQAAAQIVGGALPQQAAATAAATLTADGFVVDYVEARDAHTLGAPSGEEIAVLAAAKLGKTRLLDNIEVRRAMPTKGA